MARIAIVFGFEADEAIHGQPELFNQKPSDGSDGRVRIWRFRNRI
jgi:hypothetical protein